MGFTFEFSFTPPSQKKPRVRTESNIVERNVEGIIEIDTCGKYFITINDCNYPLSIQSYKCENRKILYSKKPVHNRFIKYIHTSKCINEIEGYIPFRVGSIVIGNLIKECGETRFNLLRFEDDNVNFIEKSKAIQKEFILNYDKYKDLI